MVCTYCNGKTEVVNSRHQKRLNQVWRRRHCLNCGATFSTHEATAYEGSWRVQDTKGALHPFLRDKLLLSVYKSLEHRPKAIEEAGNLVATIMASLAQQADRGLLETDNIAFTTHAVLKNFDTAAAVHYAAFHKL